MRLTDNSGGIWSEVLLRHKNLNLVVKQRVVPSRELMHVIGLEMIDSIKGGVKHKFMIKSNGKGGVVFHRFASGSYPYGIQKRISPDGTPYEPLAESTLRHREWKGIARGAAFILRETGRHIIQGLKIVELTQKRVEIGWTGDSERIATIQDQGGPTNTPWFGDFKLTEVLARHFRGFQNSFIDNLRNILLDFFKQ